MKIKSILASLVLMAGSLWGQSQFSNGSGNGAKISGSIINGDCAEFLNATTLEDAGTTCGGSATPAFSAITSGTNTNALVIGTGGSLGTSGTGTITATGVSGGTLGQILTVTPAAASKFKNAFKWDSSLETGADAGIRAQNLFSYLANSGLNLGATVTLENETSIDMSVNPFCGNTSAGANYIPVRPSLILSPNVANAHEVPIIVAAGCTYATFKATGNGTGQSAELSGPSAGIGEDGGLAGGIEGATLVRGANYPVAGSTGSTCNDNGVLCLTYVGTIAAVVDDGTHGTGASGCGWNFSTASPSFRGCVTGTGTQFAHSFLAAGTGVAPGGYFRAPPTVAAAQVVGNIDNVQDDTHLTLTQQVGATLSTTLTGVGYAVAYPDIEAGLVSINGGGGDNAGVMIHDLSDNASQAPAAIGLINVAATEGSSFYNLSIFNWMLAGLIVEGNATQSSKYNNIQTNPGVNCEAQSISVLLNGKFANGGPQSYANSIQSDGHGCAGPSYGNGIVVTYGQIDIGPGHGEQQDPAILVGGYPTCTTSPCPYAVYQNPANALFGVKIHDYNFNCSIGLGCGHAIQLGTYFAGIGNFTVQNVEVNSTYTDSFTDGKHAFSLTTTNNKHLSLATIDASGNWSYATFNPADPINSIASDCYSLICTGYDSNGLATVGLNARAVVGSASADTILATDCNAPTRVGYSGTAAVAITLPTATTLLDSHCTFILANNLSAVHDLTVTPTTWTVNGSATLLIHNGQIARFSPDPASSTNWLADVTEQGITAGSNVTLTRGPLGLTVAAAGGGGSLDQITGAAAQATGTETAAGHNYTFAGVETAARTSPFVIQNTSANAAASNALIINGAGISTGEVPLDVNSVAGTGDLQQWHSGETITNGVSSSGTLEAHVAATGAFTGLSFVSNGSTAGFTDFPQGPSSAAIAPCNTANSICFQAPTSVTSQLRVFASAPATGFPFYTNSSGTMTETITPVEGTISAGTALFGNTSYPISTVIAQTIAVAAGHFTNLVITSSVGGSCTTAPTFNVFDGTTNVGTAKLATSTTQTKGVATSQTQSLTFAAGDLIGIYISIAGATCTTDTWAVAAEYSTP